MRLIRFKSRIIFAFCISEIIRIMEVGWGEKEYMERARGEKRRGEGHVFSIWWPGGGNVQVIKYVNM